ncbi:GntR family transcriptional regulator [Candidatus Stoquefichus sp. SB1]|jgi:GntR family transcriptional regulator|uniref:GntR family transcriptional regulator n=1 Tax=Candidatus Stoquefichus sp. SB1 TaxID=1658109 RepID=UPI00067EC586|nr:GntR family transcriptional regulator [Candidatus Stoquefichus sp. SB1]
MNNFNANAPIYLQVVEDIKIKIMNGTLRPGDKISSVRELALELEVNPNTIQRAFSELEREGFIRTERAVGRFVADNLQLINECKQKQIRDNVHVFIEQMQILGVSKEDIVKYLNEEEEYGNVTSDTECK